MSTVKEILKNAKKGLYNVSVGEDSFDSFKNDYENYVSGKSKNADEYEKLKRRREALEAYSNSNRGNMSDEDYNTVRNFLYTADKNLDTYNEAYKKVKPLVTLEKFNSLEHLKNVPKSNYSKYSIDNIQDYSYNDIKAKIAELENEKNRKKHKGEDTTEVESLLTHAKFALDNNYSLFSTDMDKKSIENRRQRYEANKKEIENGPKPFVSSVSANDKHKRLSEDELDSLLYLTPEDLGMPKGGKKSDKGATLKNDPTSPEMYFSDAERFAKEEKARIGSLIAENKAYDRTQGVLDEYASKYPDELVADAEINKDYNNPTNAINPIDKNKSGLVSDKLGYYLDNVPSGRKNTGHGGLYDLFKYDKDSSKPAVAIVQGDDNGWGYLEDEEINRYYYIYQTEGQKSAYSYLDRMTDELQRRAEEENTEWAKDLADSGWLGSIGASAVSVPLKAIGGFNALGGDVNSLITNGELHPYSPEHTMFQAGETAREEVANNMDGYWGNIYQGAMSGVDSVVGGMAISPELYVASMFAQAGTSSVRELWKEGASNKEIAALSLAKAINEGLFEYLSLDKIIELSKGGGFKNFVKSLLIGSAIEGSEEVTTEMANILADVAIRGEQAKINSDEDYNVLKEMWDSFVGGAIGGVVGGGFAASAKAKKTLLDQHRTNKLGSEIVKTGNDAELYKSAQEIVASQENSKITEPIKKALAKVDAVSQKVINEQDSSELSNSKEYKKAIGELSRAMQTQSDVFHNTFVHIQSELADTGLSEDKIDETALAINKSVFGGQKLTQSEQKILDNPQVKTKLNEIKSEKEDISVAALGVAVNSREKSIQNLENVYPEIKKQREEQRKANEDIKAKQNIINYSDDGKTYYNDEAVEVGNIKSMTLKNGKSNATIELSNGEIVPVKDVVFGSEKQGIIYEGLLDMQSDIGVPMNKSLANMIINLSKNYSDEQSVAYIASVQGAIQNGYIGTTAKLSNNILSDAEYNAFYEEGQTLRKENRQRRQENNKRRTVRVETNAEQSEGAEKKRVTFEKGLSEEDLNYKQRVQVRGVELLSEVFPADYVFFKSENGDATVTIKGNKKKISAQGVYSIGDGKIYIDVNAGKNSQGTILYTVAHELTHFMRDFAPEQFDEFAEFLVSKYDKSGENINDLIKRRRQKEKDETFDYAYEEVIAESCVSFLTDTNLANVSAELKQKNNSLWNRIKEGLNKILNEIKRIYSSKKFAIETPEGQIVNQWKDVIEELRNKWIEGVKVASQNKLNAENSEQKNNTADNNGQVKYQIKYPRYTNEDISENIESLAHSNSVYNVSESKLQKTGKLPSELFTEFFDSIGNNIYSEKFGDVELIGSSVHSEIRHGITAEKLASIEAIPSVIIDGKVIFYKESYKENLDRIVIAAPINIGNTSYYMGVMLQRDNNTQRLYFHNVAIEKDTATITESDLLTTGDTDNDHIFISTILQNALAVKYQNKIKNEIEQKINSAGLNLKSKDNNKNNLRIRKYLKENYPNIADRIIFKNDKYIGKVTVLKIKTDSDIAENNKVKDLRLREQQEIEQAKKFYNRIKTPSGLKNLISSISSRLENDSYNAIVRESKSAVKTLSFYVEFYQDEDFEEPINTIKISDHFTNYQQSEHPDEYFVNLRECVSTDDVYSKIKSIIDTIVSKNDNDIKRQDRSVEQLDTEYLNAVKNNDMKTAQRLVDELAEKSMSNSKVRDEDGKLLKVYHGRVSKFNFFDKQFGNIEGDFGKGFYFTNNENDVNRNYANEDGQDLKNKIELLAERLEYEEEYSDLDYEQRKEIAKQRFISSEPNIVEAYLNIQNPVYISPDENGTFLDMEYDEDFNDYSGKLIDFVEALRQISSDYSYRDVDFGFLFEYGEDGMYASDAVGVIKRRILDELTDDNGDIAVNEVIRQAFEQIGFDGIIDTSVSYKFHGMNLTNDTTHYIAFNSEQIKSADPVTYDDNGDIIPLSERFNEDNKEYRYQARGGFGNALNKNEWASFYSSLMKSNQRNAFRIGDNGILIPDENNSVNYKLVCYEGDSDAPIVTAVYKLENYDYNMHDGRINIIQNITRLEELGVNDKRRRQLLQDYSSLSGAVFRRYNRKTGRFVKYTRESISNRENDRQKPDRAGVSENAGRGIPNRKPAELDGELLKSQDRPSDEDLFFGFDEDEDALLDDYVVETYENDGAGAIARLIYDMELDSLSDLKLLDVTHKVFKKYNLTGYVGVADELIKAIKDGKYFDTFTDAENDFSQPLVRAIREAIDGSYVTNKEKRELYLEARKAVQGVYSLTADQYSNARRVFGSNKAINKAFSRFGIRIVYGQDKISKIKHHTTLDKAWENANSILPEWFVYAADLDEYTDSDVVFYNESAPENLFERMNTLYNAQFERADYSEIDKMENHVFGSLIAEAISEKDKMDKTESIKKLKAELKRKNEEKIKKIKAKNKERIKEIRQKDKERLKNKEKKIREDYKQQRERQQDRRIRTEFRHKIRKTYEQINSWIYNPQINKFVPKEFLKQTAEVLKAINIDTGRSAKLTQKFKDLRLAYEDIIKNGGSESVYDPVVSSLLANCIEVVGDTPIMKMSVTQLKAIDDTLTALKLTIQHTNELVDAENRKKVTETGDKFISEIKQAKYTDVRFFTKWWNSQKSPKRFFNYICGFAKNNVGLELYRMLDDGQLKSTALTVQFYSIFSDLVRNEKALKSLHDKVDIGLVDEKGKPVKISIGMALSIYMHLKNKQNTIHIAGSGFRVPGLKEYYKGDKAKAYGEQRALVSVYNLEKVDALDKERLSLAERIEEAQKKGEDTFELENQLDGIKKQIWDLQDKYIYGIRNNVEKVLFDNDVEHKDYYRGWIAASKYFFDVASKNALNETTMKKYGFEKARVENYFPIHSDKSFLTQDFESIIRDMSLENSGFMKDRVNSSNVILLEDIVDVVNAQIDKVAIYCGMMIPIDNFKKVYNYKKNRNISVVDTLKNKFNNAATNYIDNLMSDLVGSRKSKSNFIDYLRHGLAGAALTGNIRVAMAQAASYPVAAATVGWKPIFKALAKGGRKGKLISRADIELISKYSPLLKYRMWGYSDREIGDLKNESRIIGDIMSKAKWFTGWIQAVDGATVGRLWYAAEFYIDDNMPNLKKGTDEYYQEVAKVFNDIVEETQPNYTTLQRPDVLRSPKEITKIFTMFMTQRLQNVNIVYDAAMTYNKFRKDAKTGANGTTSQDVKEAIGDLVHAVSSQAVSLVVLVGMKALAATLLHSIKGYKDDDDELTAESAGLKLLDDFMNNLIGSFAFGGEIYSFVKGMITGKGYYGISMSGMDTLMDFVTGLYDLRTETNKYNIPSDMYKLAKLICQAFGVPANNIELLAEGLTNWAIDISNGEFMKSDFQIAPYVSTSEGRKIEYDRMMKDGTVEEEIQKQVDERYNACIENGYTDEEAKKKSKSDIKRNVTEYCKSKYLKAVDDNDNDTKNQVLNFMLDSHLYDESKRKSDSSVKSYIINKLFVDWRTKK